MTQPQPVGGGSFDVDITRAPQAIRQLEEARDELYAIRDEAQLLAQVNPPTRDQVSLDAAYVLARKGAGEPGSFQSALDEGIAEVTRLIDALHAGFAEYQASDESAAAQLRQ
jgi:hypothetical protein